MSDETLRQQLQIMRKALDYIIRNNAKQGAYKALLEEFKYQARAAISAADKLLNKGR